ncbi:MAG: iron ABC transporter permease [Corynebacterium sp.]|nr:iron ABC transporter permease [Corynebacterium sp.]
MLGGSNTDTRHVSDAFARRHIRRIILFTVISVALIIGAVWSLLVGQYAVSLGDIPRILSVGPTGATSMDESVIWRIRIPRVVVGLLVGASLGVGGALTQAVFANPLAEPSIIGVTSGAGVGAAVVVVFNLSFLGDSTIALGAFITGVLTTVLVYRLSKMGGKVQVITLILVGIATNAVANALISFLMFLAPATGRDQIIFWQMGSLNGSQWSHASVLLVIVAVCLIGAVWLAPKLDVLALGDAAAYHVGINVPVVRLAAIVLATALTAGAVAYAGIISFVGLIIPHIIRVSVGPSNRVLVVASAIAGAALICIADIAARTVIPFADLPIGIFTALVGGPTFFLLLRRMVAKGGLR